MKIRVKKPFRYQFDAQTVKEIAVGIYVVPTDFSLELAGKILRFGDAEVVAEKKAPENKIVKVPENKTKVAGKPVRRRRTRSKSDA